MMAYLLRQAITLRLIPLGPRCQEQRNARGRGHHHTLNECHLGFRPWAAKHHTLTVPQPKTKGVPGVDLNDGFGGMQLLGARYPSGKV